MTIDTSIFFERFLNGNKEIVHRVKTPRSPATYQVPSEPLHPELDVALREMGIEGLYSHQAEAIDSIRRVQSVVIVTSTASGKTFCYTLPIIDRLLRDPRARALLIFPTKALAQDQLKSLARFRAANPKIAFEAGCYDGDTPPDLRRRLRDEGSIILTNPDMLHQGILPNHSRWAHFFANLEFVVIDEIHSYRGVFGSNVANVMRRLRRIASHYSAAPKFVSCSATIANPKEHAEGITGEHTAEITKDGSPHGEKQYLLFNPDFIDTAKLTRRGPFAVARKLMANLVKERIQTITFVRSRYAAELVYRYCQETLAKKSPTLAQSVKAYRSGYLPVERREVEKGLAEGRLLGVVSTNALELGIDIGGLDASLIVSYPGTIASFWQQAGRAGRGDDRSLVILIAQNTPIDQFLMNNPDYLFSQSPEHATIDPDNPQIAIFHLQCALRELPLKPLEYALFGEHTLAMLDILKDNELASYIGDQWHWASDTYPAAESSLRNGGADIYAIMDDTSKRVIGNIDAESVPFETHENAVYLHDADTYFVKKLDTENNIVFVERRDLDYYTRAMSDSSILVDDTEDERHWLDNMVFFGDVTVTTVIPMFKKVKFYNRDSIGYEKLSLPPQKLETVAAWLVPGANAMAKVAHYGATAVDALKGIANVLVDIASLHLMADQGDIGTVVDATNTGSPTLFVYDRYPYGIGYAAKLYEVIDKVLFDTLKVIKTCQCSEGCPSCVGSAMPAYAMTSIDSGTRGVLPDKEVAIVLLHEMLGLEPYEPKFIKPRPHPASLPKEAEPKPVGEPSEPPTEFKRLPTRTEDRIRRRLRGQGDKAKE
ncbi:MAG: DEAD/DEAH box helicase [Candidatus Coatesbacteria bacterium]|nr:DEAD/DEAH box helicase [Candidatus Coatesbacteria bacterium]